MGVILLLKTIWCIYMYIKFLKARIQSEITVNRLYKDRAKHEDIRKKWGFFELFSSQCLYLNLTTKFEYIPAFIL